jgi:hypothetical protein
MSFESKNFSFTADEVGTKTPSSRGVLLPTGVVGSELEFFRPELGVLGGFRADPIAPPNGNPSSSLSLVTTSWPAVPVPKLDSIKAAPFAAASLTRSRAFEASAIARIPKDFITGTPEVRPNPP